MAVLLIGTLDTKGVELRFVRDVLKRFSLETIVVNAGVQPPAFEPDISAERLFAAGGTTLAAVRAAGDRGRAIDAAAKGAAKLALDLHSRGQVHGVFGLGGSA